MRRLSIFLSSISILAAMEACTHANQEELTVTGDVLDVTEYSATLTGYSYLPLEMGDAQVGIIYDSDQSFKEGKTVPATGLDGNNMFTVTVSGLIPNTTYYYKSYVQNGMAIKYGTVLSFTTKESLVPAGAVDLGIVMTRDDGTTYKLYWAKSNLSEDGLCANPEDFGDYYAWAETEPYYSSQNPLIWKDGKTGYNWPSYKWCNNRYTSLTKYNDDSSYGTVDYKTVLEPEDDVAHVKLGASWRIPTYSEWMALRENCTWTWSKLNGVDGQLATSKINGSSLFFPAAGRRVNEVINDMGTFGYYWSSTRDEYSPNAWNESLYRGDVMRYNYFRCDGMTVRPVSE